MAHFYDFTLNIHFISLLTIQCREKCLYATLSSFKRQWSCLKCTIKVTALRGINVVSQGVPSLLSQEKLSNAISLQDL